MAKQTLEFTRTIQAAPEMVFRALTNGTALREWLCDTALFDARPGGNYYAAWNSGYYATGQVLKLTAPSKLTLTWLGRGYPEATEVKIAVAKKKAGAVVTVTQAGVGTGKKWGSAYAEVKDGWEKSLENLQSVLETGEDLRFTLRPMLGVSGLEDVDAATAARLKLPAARGLRLDGTVEGMGARAAGLQKDDVLVGLGRQKVQNYATLLTALQAYRGGDTVEVVYYRDGVKQSAPMTLSRRALPAIPGTAAELAEAMRAVFAGGDATLERVLAGVTEAEADYRTRPGEWNVKETLAHLIANERDSHIYMVDLIASDERVGGFQANSDLRLKAIAQAYGTAAALVEELKRNEAETVAVLAGLPEAFIAEKRTYWRLAYSLLAANTHVDEHAEQITNAVAAARAAGKG
ncbi:MAG: SRPBCC domain-containing protein [Anaerolineales bacterium]|nr:SRPBCC domain-containing protein [Anaerolineales bacterium]